MNKMLYDSEDLLKKSLFGLQNQTVGHLLGSKPLKSFWTGMRHLNSTDWFDSKNNVLNLRPDERNWWPWLIVDSKTYSQGSCVGKKRDWFFMDDCYKRMSFACQTSPIISANKGSLKTDIQFKCGQKLSVPSSNKAPLLDRQAVNTTKNTYEPDLALSDTILVHGEHFLGKGLPLYSSSSPVSTLNLNKVLFVKNSTSKVNVQTNLMNLALFTAKKNAPSAEFSSNSISTDSSKKYS